MYVYYIYTIICICIRIVILPVVLYVSETWVACIEGEHRLKVFKNMVPRRIFGPKRDQVTGDWRGLHNEDLCALYTLPNIIQEINKEE
jgi:hypothetical protein